ncbi:MAG: type III pantothenate kinase [Nitrospirae bacterium]|nr:type III pantothenate kinase [Nitrospirota bacterium]
MLIAIDIGNTNIKLGLFQGDTLIKHSIPLGKSQCLGETIGGFIRWHIDLEADTWIPAFAGMTEKKQGMTEGNPFTPDLSFPRKRESSNSGIEGVIVSSVVPALTGQICSIAGKYSATQPHIVTYLSSTGLSFSVPHPERLGVDRITAAAWAYHYFNAPAAVIDFGTATTISIVGQSGVFIGGAIMPGLTTMSRALNTQTAALPHVELVTPSGALGADTRQAIISGIVYGTAGAVARIIYEIEREIGYNLKIAITGGNMAVIAPCLERVDVAEQDLLLLALKIIHERMR